MKKPETAASAFNRATRPEFFLGDVSGEAVDLRLDPNLLAVALLGGDVGGERGHRRPGSHRVARARPFLSATAAPRSIERTRLAAVHIFLATRLLEDREQ